MSGHGSDPLEAVARALEGSLLNDFEIRRKIGGKDISTGSLAQTVTMHGVCSYVYDAVCRLPAPEVSGRAFALKVMINMQGEQTMDLHDAYRAEYELLADTQKLPRHPNITCVLRHFNDLATPERVPGFDFDPQDVSARTTFLVMPLCDGGDLKGLMNRKFQAGQHFTEAELRSLLGQLWAAVAHLQRHRISHRDIKADNIMLQSQGEGREPRLILIDFGVCMNFAEYGLDAFRLPLPVNMPRGGAPGFLAPEIVTPRPGPGRFLDYAKNDGWASGMLMHSMLSGPAATPPFSCGDDPRQFADQHYSPPDLGPGGISPVFGEVCRGLLRVDPTQRLTVAEAAEQLRPPPVVDVQVKLPSAGRTVTLSVRTDSTVGAIKAQLQRAEVANIFRCLFQGFEFWYIAPLTSLRTVEPRLLHTVEPRLPLCTHCQHVLYLLSVLGYVQVFVLVLVLVIDRIHTGTHSVSLA